MELYSDEIEFQHVSVLLWECIEGLNIKGNGVYVDGTLGGAGHSKEICKRLSHEGRLIGIDQDEQACQAAAKVLEPFGKKAVIVRSNFEHMSSIVHEQGYEGVDGILLDLGVSSYQLDTPERGFSYREDAPLDMRMDQGGDLTAKDVVNQYSSEELFRVIKEYGEEKYASSIVRTILKTREQHSIQSTKELVEIIEKSIPPKARYGKGHPAKRTFQAIRIECNRELDVLKNTLEDMIALLNPGGRLCVITFHSLEDRLVKQCFQREENPCTCPPGLPVCVCGKRSRGGRVNRKPILPSEEEREKNPRSKSAKLRIFEKNVE